MERLSRLKECEERYLYILDGIIASNNIPNNEEHEEYLICACMAIQIKAHTRIFIQIDPLLNN